MKRRAFVVLLLALAACSTNDRVWRVSPLAGEGESSPDRVNVWPLFYHGDEGTSVLWPIFDVDEDGFALRPIMSRDRALWGVLWPWMQWDTEANEGWAFPYYALQDNRGIFPVANFGEYSWVGPAWWRKGDQGEAASGGLFPLAYFGEFDFIGPWWLAEDGWGFFPVFGKNFAGVNHVGPAWWTEGAQSYGFLPLFHYGHGGKQLAVLPFYAHVLEEESSDRYYLMGLGRTYRTSAYERDWILPLWYDFESEGAEDELLFPFYYRRGRGEEAHVFTLLGDRREAPEGSSLNLYPFWWSSDSEKITWKMLVPLFYYGDRAGERNLITPLGGRGWSASGKTRYVNVVGPLFHWSRTEDGSESRTAFLWPLFERHREGDEISTRGLPFFVHQRSPEGSEVWFAAGLGHHARDEDSNSWRVSPLAAVSRSNSDELEIPSQLYEFSLYGDHVHGQKTSRYLFPLYQQQSDATSWESSFLLGLGYFARNGDARAWRVWPLVAYADGMRPEGPAHWTVVYARARWEGGSSLNVGTPLIYSHSEDEGYARSSKETVVLTFLSLSSEERVRDYIPVEIAPALGDRVESRRLGILLGLFRDESSQHRRWKQGVVDEVEAATLRSWSAAYDEPGSHNKARDPDAARAILAEHDALPDGTDEEALPEAVRAFASENTELVGRREGGVPLIYGYESSPERTEWYGLLWALHHEHDPESSSTSILYYGYRSKTKGGTTSRDIFPFITWDTSEDGEQKTISFLWRLFRYERKGERRGGYFFFFPWGHVSPPMARRRRPDIA